MSWGYRIAALYASFAVFMIGLVVLCMTQKDIFLVEKEYYKEEIHYQDKLDKLTSTARLQHPLTMVRQGESLTITYPPEAQPTQGDIWLFRPNDGDMDKHLLAKADEAGVQQVALAGLAPGLWRVKLDWQSAGRHYFQEKELNLPATH